MSSGRVQFLDPKLVNCIPDLAILPVSLLYVLFVGRCVSSQAKTEVG